MLKFQVVQQSHTAQTLVPWHNPFISSTVAGASSLIRLKPTFSRKLTKKVVVGCVPSTIKAVATSAEQSTSVKAIVTVKVTVGGTLTNIGLNRGLDDITDLLGKSVLLELVSAELDPQGRLKHWATKTLTLGLQF